MVDRVLVVACLDAKHSNVIEAALTHQDEIEIRRAYNRATYWPERVKLLQEWADLLDEFKRLTLGGRRAA